MNPKMADEPLPLKRILQIGISVGIIAGLGALLFFKGVELGSQFILTHLLGYAFPAEGMAFADLAGWTAPASLFLILPVLMLGALISGLIVWKFAPEAEGHGTDAALKAYHGDGKIRWRVPIVKAVSSIITISTGGSAGCEGPAAQISAGFGSIISDIFHLSPRERKIAIAVGIGAGVGAIFKAPLGGAILAAEILYLRDFRYDVILPSFIASVTGYGIFGLFEGYTPLFGTIAMFWSVGQLPLFILLGILSAGVGILYIKSFYGTKKIFDRAAARYHIPKFLKPVIGAGIIGLTVILLGLISPEAFLIGLGSLGTGYGFVQLSLYNLLPFGVLLFLPLAKILATSLTIGSGASGGVFAPGLSIGGFTGGAFGLGMHLLLPDLVALSAVPIFVIIGMIAVFGGVAHAPVAVLIMVLEMTGSFSLVIPAILAVAVSCLLMKNITIFKQQRISREDNRLPEEIGR
ncbi:MAG: chloride channel protein [Methanocorpusculum sp.]|nr:chloride channel protein [Methanocorpusculum sp.]